MKPGENYYSVSGPAFPIYLEERSSRTPSSLLIQAVDSSRLIPAA